MSMSTATGRSHMVVFNILYDLRVNFKTPCNCITLSLWVEIVVVATRGGDNHGARRHVGGDGDRAGALEMEIKSAKEEKAIPCHIILACDVYPFYASCFA